MAEGVSGRSPMVFSAVPLRPDEIRARLGEALHQPEAAIVERLLTTAAVDGPMRDRIDSEARRLVENVRRKRQGPGGLDAFLQEFGSIEPEGVVLMCLAEALLRIPDAETADRLIRDKTERADWASHLGQSRVAVRQRLDLGADADRPRDAASTMGEGLGCHAWPAGRAPRASR